MSAAEDLRQALKKSVEESSEDRLSNLEVDTSDLRVSVQHLIKITNNQTEILNQQTTALTAIQKDTKDMIAAWSAASGAWKTVELLSKVAKVVAPIVLSVGVFWGVFTHATKDNWVKMLELFK